MVVSAGKRTEKGVYGERFRCARDLFMSIEFKAVLFILFVQIMMGLRNAKHLFAASERGS